MELRCALERCRADGSARTKLMRLLPPARAAGASGGRMLPPRCSLCRLMMVHLPALLAALVYVAATPAVASSRLLLEDAAARPVLPVGFGAEPRMPMSSLENSQPKGTCQ